MDGVSHLRYVWREVGICDTVLIGEYDSTVNKIVFLNKIVCLGPPL